MWVIPRNVSFYSQRIVDTDRLWKKEHIARLWFFASSVCAQLSDLIPRSGLHTGQSTVPCPLLTTVRMHSHRKQCLFLLVYFERFFFFFFLFYYRRGVKSVSLQMRWVKTGVHLFGRILINWRNLLFTEKNKNARSLGHLGDGILKKK